MWSSLTMIAKTKLCEKNITELATCGSWKKDQETTLVARLIKATQPQTTIITSTPTTSIVTRIHGDWRRRSPGNNQSVDFPHVVGNQHCQIVNKLDMLDNSRLPFGKPVHIFLLTDRDLQQHVLHDEWKPPKLNDFLANPVRRFSQRVRQLESL